VLHSVLHEVQQREIVEIEIVGGHQDRDITYPHLDVNSENERMRELRHRSIDDEATLARFQNSFTKDTVESQEDPRVMPKQSPSSAARRC